MGGAVLGLGWEIRLAQHDITLAGMGADIVLAQHDVMLTAQ